MQQDQDGHIIVQHTLTDNGMVNTRVYIMLSVTLGVFIVPTATYVWAMSMKLYPLIYVCIF